MCYGGCDCQRCNPPDEPQVTQSAWTTEKPTTAGRYYWFRRWEGFGRDFILFIYKANGGLMVEQLSGEITALKDFESGEWQPVEPWKD